jgi:hypothetical protein
MDRLLKQANVDCCILVEQFQCSLYIIPQQPQIYKPRNSTLQSLGEKPHMYLTKQSAMHLHCIRLTKDLISFPLMNKEKCQGHPLLLSFRSSTKTRGANPSLIPSKTKDHDSARRRINPVRRISRVRDVSRYDSKAIGSMLSVRSEHFFKDIACVVWLEQGFSF